MEDHIIALNIGLANKVVEDEFLEEKTIEWAKKISKQSFQSLMYSRKFRDSLKGNWGVYDTDDCIAAVDYLSEKGLVDSERAAIKGGSAGGYTTINALTFHDRFAVGATYYGIADLSVFIDDTHKFESKYLESLIGKYPEEKDKYYDRSFS